MSAQGYFSKLHAPPGLLRLGMNLWPPFRGAGIKVTHISRNYREVDVTLKLGVLNRNYFGTQFGGSLYAMTDPFHALMIFRNLGSAHIVWDKAGAIRYVKPGRGRVFARFRLADDAIRTARDATVAGAKYEPVFSVDIIDAAGEVVAVVDKTLHIRRKAA